MFSPSTYMVSSFFSFTFRSLIHLEFVLVGDVCTDESKSIFCLMASQLFQHYLLIVSSFSTDLKYHIIHIPRSYNCLIVTKMALILYVCVQFIK